MGYLYNAYNWFTSPAPAYREGGAIGTKYTAFEVPDAFWGMKRTAGIKAFETVKKTAVGEGTLKERIAAAKGYTTKLEDVPPGRQPGNGYIPEKAPIE